MFFALHPSFVLITCRRPVTVKKKFFTFFLERSLPTHNSGRAVHSQPFEFSLRVSWP